MCGLSCVRVLVRVPDQHGTGSWHWQFLNLAAEVSFCCCAVSKVSVDFIRGRVVGSQSGLT
jgi:hypothetical protein